MLFFSFEKNSYTRKASSHGAGQKSGMTLFKQLRIPGDLPKVLIKSMWKLGTYRIVSFFVALGTPLKKLCLWERFWTPLSGKIFLLRSNSRRTSGKQRPNFSILESYRASFLSRLTEHKKLRLTLVGETLIKNADWKNYWLQLTLEWQFQWKTSRTSSKMFTNSSPTIWNIVIEQLTWFSTL